MAAVLTGATARSAIATGQDVPRGHRRLLFQVHPPLSQARLRLPCNDVNVCVFVCFGDGWSAKAGRCTANTSQPGARMLKKAVNKPGHPI